MRPGDAESGAHESRQAVLAGACSSPPVLPVICSRRLETSGCPNQFASKCVH